MATERPDTMNSLQKQPIAILDIDITEDEILADLLFPATNAPQR